MALKLPFPSSAGGKVGWSGKRNVDTCKVRRKESFRVGSNVNDVTNESSSSENFLT